MKVGWNGAVVDETEARISPFDHGLLVGDGAFETIRVYRSVPFAWRRHYQRLVGSAGGLGLSVPSSDALRAATDEVLEANALSEGRLRLTITGGPAPLGSERGDAPPTIVIAATAMKPWPPSEAVVTAPWPRNERGATAGLKTISYAENVRALAFARDHDASEAMFCNTQGALCEATGSNVFIVRGGRVITPEAGSGCLLGVTRALVLELCADEGLPVEERVVAPDELAAADEAFLTSSTREVQPISQVDSRQLPQVPGPVTQRLADAFRSLVERDLDP